MKNHKIEKILDHLAKCTEADCKLIDFLLTQDLNAKQVLNIWREQTNRTRSTTEALGSAIDE